MSSFGALVVHGLFEHRGRHQDNVAWLEKLGIEAYSFNLPGHGEVDEKGHIESWDENIIAISKAYENIKAKDKKIIFAHSYGSLVSVSAILQNKMSHSSILQSLRFWQIISCMSHSHF